MLVHSASQPPSAAGTLSYPSWRALGCWWHGASTRKIPGMDLPSFMTVPTASSQLGFSPFQPTSSTAPFLLLMCPRVFIVPPVILEHARIFGGFCGDLAGMSPQWCFEHPPPPRHILGKYGRQSIAHLCQQPLQLCPK